MQVLIPCLTIAMRCDAYLFCTLEIRKALGIMWEIEFESSGIDHGAGAGTG